MSAPSAMPSGSAMPSMGGGGGGGGFSAMSDQETFGWVNFSVHDVVLWRFKSIYQTRCLPYELERFG